MGEKCSKDRDEINEASVDICLVEEHPAASLTVCVRVLVPFMWSI
jgi:hypothetical protein